MAWLLIDDGFTNHEKIAGLGDRAFRLHVAALCYCARNLTDGRLNPAAVRVVCAEANAAKRHTQELEAAGLWVAAGAGYEINDYLKYNPTAEQVKARRARNAERQARQRTLRNAGSNAVTNGVTHGVSNSAPALPLKSKAFTGERLKCPHCTVQVKTKQALEEHLHVLHDVELSA